MVAKRRGPRRGGKPPLVWLDEPSTALWDEDLADVTKALLGSAVLCFAEKGFQATTTRDITGKVGLTPGALYVHFSTKEEVLFEIVRSGHRRALEALRAALPTGGDPEGHLRRVVAVFVEWHAEHHTTARVCQYELTPLSAEHYEEILGLRAQFNTIFRDAVSGVVDGATADPDDVSRLARSILSLGVDLVRWYRLGGTDTPASLGAFYADLAVHMTAAVRGRRPTSA
ncbi:TetR/AcrR family transcriptional regulator [Nonomuraea rhizosphaerae]|uniref:TetR/AcrR family transcriptional regulator n=1 Tax=Nonomuraea rhizosphaerae TaxID=2665663 RepID=UPI001C5DC445|nr:TetR/AcrR family transcriptional regulator [Nonomuraea rhizosphaerae]